MSPALDWWLAHGADAGPWLAGLCVVLAAGLLLLAVALRLGVRLLTVGAVTLGGAWLVDWVMRRRRKKDYYTWYLGTAAWKAQAQAARQRAGNRCAHCQARVRLDVHHLTYERLGRERPADLIALCRRCHDRVHASQQVRPPRQVATAPRKPVQKYAPRKRGSR